MPKYDYACENKLTCGWDGEVTHPVAACDDDHCCPVCGCLSHRVIKTVPTVAFLGPGFASNDHVARANVGRNPSNQTRYSK